MSLNARLHNTCAADLKSCLQHIMFLKKYTKNHDITVKIFHIVMFYLSIHKKAAKAAKNRLLELNSTIFLLQVIKIMRCYNIYSVVTQCSRSH